MQWRIPAHTFNSLYRYYRLGIPGGDFLQSVLKNLGWEAAARADPQNRAALADIFLFNHKARDYEAQCRSANDYSGYDMMWAAWRIRYSPEADEIEGVELGEDDD